MIMDLLSVVKDNNLSEYQCCQGEKGDCELFPVIPWLFHIAMEAMAHLV